MFYYILSFGFYGQRCCGGVWKGLIIVTLGSLTSFLLLPQGLLADCRPCLLATEVVVCCSLQAKEAEGHHCLQFFLIIFTVAKAQNPTKNILVLNASIISLFVKFFIDNSCLSCFTGDDTLKMWDIRQFKKPLHSAERLPSFFPM